MSTSATGSIAVEHPGPWDAVIDFNEIETPDIAANFLPSWAGAFVHELSACAQTPECFGVMLGFSTVAACVQGRVCVSPYGDTYREPTNLWTVAAMSPGSRKTYVQEQLTQPLVQWEIERASAMRSEISEAEAARAIVLKRIEKLTNDASKKSDPIERAAIGREIAQLSDTIPDPKRAPRLFTSDCTPERFQSLLVEHNERMSVLSDEGGIFEVMSGLYSDGHVNLDVFMQSHAGSRVRVDRGKREAWLDHPLSTFGLAVQPAVIEGLSQGSKRQLRGKGCLARFLYCIPVSNIGHRDLSRRRVISEETQRRYRDGIRSLLDYRPSIPDGVERPRVVRPDREGLLSWTAYLQALEPRQSQTGDLSAISDWTAKLPGAVLRLAALSHVIENGLDNPVISRATIERTLDLAELLIPHALCAFSMMGGDQAVADAKHVARWIKAKRASHVKQNDIYRACHGRIPKMDRLQKALTILIDQNILSEPASGATGGRPSIWYFINPEYLEANQ